ncbi:hypothetical protein, partial [Kitasatospora sp. MY 5-36]|uniref:hypothetical protein n=1 Tax=Kitasatospora sp. MY 5-36 TaxID=1678027 RepID=UPI001F29571F
DQNDPTKKGMDRHGPSLPRRRAGTHDSAVHRFSPRIAHLLAKNYLPITSLAKVFGQLVAQRVTRSDQK